MPIHKTQGNGSVDVKEKRFVAANMMQAMRKLTEAFGADAILLSSRRIETGVEVIGLPPGEKPSRTDFSKLHSDRRHGDRRSRGRRVSDQMIEEELSLIHI